MGFLYTHPSSSDAVLEQHSLQWGATIFSTQLVAFTAVTSSTPQNFCEQKEK